MLEQETKYHQLSQEQLDNFSLDMNAAYARLKGMEDAINSKKCTSALTILHSSGEAHGTPIKCYFRDHLKIKKQKWNDLNELN